MLNFLKIIKDCVSEKIKFKSQMPEISDMDYVYNEFDYNINNRIEYCSRVNSEQKYDHVLNKNYFC